MLLGLTSTYPVRGLYFFLRKENRPILWRRAAAFACEVTASCTALLGSLIGFTFHAQLRVVLSIVPHFFGVPGTVTLILIETAIPVVVFFYHRLHRVQEKLFVDVLQIVQGAAVEPASPRELEWIANHRLELQRHDESHTSGPSCNCCAVYTNPETLNDHPKTKYILTLPINLIPVVGWSLFCYINAMEAGTSLHHYYYKHLKGLSSEDEATLVRLRKTQYQQFGIVASALSLFPGANIVLVLTNAVGAALWAADIEKHMKKRL